MGRSLLIILVPVIILQMIISYFFIERHWKSMTNRLSTALIGEINFVISEIEDADASANLREAIRNADRYLEMDVHIYPGQKVERQYEPGWRPNVFSEFARVFETKTDRTFNIRHVDESKNFHIEIDSSKGMVVFSCPERRLYSATTYIFLLWSVCAAFILVSIAMIFMRNQIRPIHRLAIAADRFGRGNDIGRFKVSGAREVRKAAQAFIDMKERITRQVEQRTAMLSGISHDLRTPLTRMKLQLAMLPENADVQSLKLDISEMERMIEAYLSFMRGEGDEQRAQVSLRDMVEKLKSDFRRQGHELDVTYNARDDYMVDCRQNVTERALANIIGNAFKYGKDVSLSLTREENGIVITVDDAGPGIPAEKHEDVFRPFYRLEESRNVKTGGMGLGLAIAQDIILSHGGTVRLAKSPRGGLRVIITLPA